MLQSKDVSENALLSFGNDIKNKQQLSSKDTESIMDIPTSQNNQTLLFNVIDSPLKCEKKLFDFDDPKNNVQSNFLSPSGNQEESVNTIINSSYKNFNQEIGRSKRLIETHEPASFNDLFNHVSHTNLSIKKNEEKLHQWNLENEFKRRERAEKEVMIVKDLKEKANVQLDEWYSDQNNKKNHSTPEERIDKKATVVTETNSVQDESLTDSLENLSKVNWKRVWQLVTKNSLQSSSRLSCGNLSKVDRTGKYISELNKATNNEESGQKRSECDISRMMQIIEQLANA